MPKANPFLQIRTSAFFDKDPIVDAMEATERKNLSRIGAFIRRTAKGLIRTDKSKSKKPSRPGRPIKSRTGLYKDNIFFSYDKKEHSVVVGPRVLNGKKVSGKTVPELHEYGGTIQVRNYLLPVKQDAGRDEKGRFLKAKVTYEKYTGRLKYERRPTMELAFEKELAKGKILGIWKDSVRAK